MHDSSGGRFHSQTGHHLNEFVRDCVAIYLEDDNIEVRRAAAATCCHVLVKDTSPQLQASSYSIQVISEVLEKILTAGIADTGMPMEELSALIRFRRIDSTCGSHFAG